MSRNEYIVNRYREGFSSYELEEEFGMTARSIQRVILKESARTGEKIVRGKSEAHKLAIKKGRMKYYRKPEHLKVRRKRVTEAQRYKVFIKCRYTCGLCGRNRLDGVKLEVDHINDDKSDNSMKNLHLLCEDCNKGKSYNSKEWLEYQDARRKFYE